MVKFEKDGGLDVAWSLVSWIRAMWILWVERTWLICSVELVMPLVFIWRMFRDGVEGPGLGWISPAWVSRARSHADDDAAEVIDGDAADDAAEEIAGDVAGEAAEVAAGGVVEDVAGDAAEVGGLGGRSGPRHGRAEGDGDVPLHQRR